MTRILILGGGGMIGSRLAEALAAEVRSNNQAAKTVLVDVGFPPKLEERFTCISGNLTDAAFVQKLAEERFDVIFHLAAIVSGEAERDFQKGWAVNTQSLLSLLQALHSEHEKSQGAYIPRLVFTSSLAVFGGPFPDAIPDDFPTRPQSSYGAQKASCELFIGDAIRKGIVTGMSLRLPTICVRPGKPNAAASSFYSGIIREPLNGERAVLPVSRALRHWFASPRAAVSFLCHAAKLDMSKLDGNYQINLPGVSCTVGDQLDALAEIAGADSLKLIDEIPDPAIENIVGSWPRNFDDRRAQALGFEKEANFAELIRTYIEEERPAGLG